jgi:hypothetical protein
MLYKRSILTEVGRGNSARSVPVDFSKSLVCFGVCNAATLWRCFGGGGGGGQSECGPRIEEGLTCENVLSVACKLD